MDSKSVARPRAILSVTLAAALCLSAPAGAIELAAHRAIYDLTLETARGDVSGASGTMSYDVVDACDGWAVHQKLAMSLINRDGQDVDMLSDYTTYESKDGTALQFRMRQTTEQSVTTDVAGDAELDPGKGGTIRYSVPENTSKPLAKGTLFPMQHTVALIEAAMAGKRFIALPLFDGTGADGAQDTTVAVAGWSGPAPARWPELAALPSGRVHVAFFNQAAGTQQPEYEVSMRYWENGIADELLMDFGDFVMRGRLKTLTLPARGC